MVKVILIMYIVCLYKDIAAYGECTDNSLFFVENVDIWNIEVSNFFCDYGRKYNIERLENTPSIKKGDFIKIEENRIALAGAQEKRMYFEKIKETLMKLKEDRETKRYMYEQYINHREEYSPFFSHIALRYLLSPFGNNKEKFLQEYGKALTMNGKIISREEWGAKSFLEIEQLIQEKREKQKTQTQKKSVSSSSKQQERRKTIRENYMRFFYKKDQEWKKVKHIFGLKSYLLEYYPVERIIIHHTASPYIGEKTRAIEYLQKLQLYHGVTLEWYDIGYHYLIDGAGNIYEGRKGGKYVLGAHTYGHNYGSIGIALITNDYVSPAMLKSLKELIAYLAQEYELNVVEPQLVRKPDLSGREWGWTVVAHKELDPIKNKDPYINMNNFRKNLQEYMLKE